jgi:cardiolipin synthase
MASAKGYVRSDNGVAGSPLRRLLRGAAALGMLAALAGCGTHTLDVLASCDEISPTFECVTPGASASGYQPANDSRDFGYAKPAAAPRGPDAVEAEYERQFVAVLAANKRAHLIEANGLEYRRYQDVPNTDLQDDFRAVSALTDEVASPLPALPASAGRGDSVRHFYRPWRTSRNVLHVGKGSSLPGAKTYYFSGLQALETFIDIDPIDDTPGTLTGSCDGPMQVRGGGTERRYEAGAGFTVAFGGGRKGTELEPEISLNRCDFTYRTDAGTYTAPLALVREETADPALAAFDSRIEVCREPPLGGLSALEKAFWRSRWLSQTCDMPVGNPTLLDDERAGFNAKVKALMGRELPAAAFDQANPEWPFDTSNAPRLSLIYVSYLDIKADFSGRVMERMLRFHAARGAKIRVILTDILALEKDKALLHKLVADYPNIHLQQFAWTPPAGARTDLHLYKLWRTHHVKMLGALSPDPGRSTAIIGGRNIHDGFLFTEPVDLTGYDGLYQHEVGGGGGLHYYSNYNDFEVAYRDDATVRRMMAHLSTLWHRDTDTTVARPYSVTVKGHGGPVTGRMRHFISVPYSDERALERQYVELIDAARSSIEFVNPYLNLTPAIGAAIERAINRGVHITVIGRIDLKGDLGGTVLTALNEEFVEKYADRIAVYEYKVPNILLHAKLLLIDGQFASISSVNFNNRSFIHDSENGMISLDRGTYRRIKAVFDSYKAKAVRLTPEVEIPWIYRMIFRSPLIREAI